MDRRSIRNCRRASSRTSTRFSKQSRRSSDCGRPGSGAFRSLARIQEKTSNIQHPTSNTQRNNVNKFPISVSEGSATVKVYNTTPKGGAYKSFTVIYWLAGRRERKVFGKLDDALAEADRVVVRLANAQTDALKLDNKDVAV